MSGTKRSTDELASINHGTEAGDKAHRRRGEKPCDSCRLAARHAAQDRRRGVRPRRAVPRGQLIRDRLAVGLPPDGPRPEDVKRWNKQEQAA